MGPRLSAVSQQDPWCGHRRCQTKQWSSLAEKGCKPSRCDPRPSAWPSWKHKGVRIPQSPNAYHRWSRRNPKNRFWGRNEQNHQTFTDEDQSHLPLLRHNDKESGRSLQTVSKEPSFDWSCQRLRIKYSWWTWTRLCCDRTFKEVPTLVYIFKKEPKKENHGFHVELQRRQILFRPFKLRWYSSQRHPRETEAIKEDQHIPWVLPSWNWDTTLHWCCSKRSWLPQSWLGYPIWPSRWSRWLHPQSWKNWKRPRRWWTCTPFPPWAWIRLPSFLATKEGETKRVWVSCRKTGND